MAARVSPEESGILPAITSTTRADSKPEEKAEKIQEAEEHPAIVRKSIKQREQEMKDELERRAAVAEKEICERLTEELTAKFANEWKASVDLEKERVEALRERLKNVESGESLFQVQPEYNDKLNGAISEWSSFKFLQIENIDRQSGSGKLAPIPFNYLWLNLYELARRQCAKSADARAAFHLLLNRVCMSAARSGLEREIV